MADPTQNDDAKVFIDEDWKAQVQREKEEAARAAAQAPEKTGEESGEGAEQAQEAGASFLGLLDGLAAQCMLALGFIAPPDAEQITVDLNQAQYVIDTLVVLRDKTKGNLTPDEEGHLTQILSELQRGFVARAQQAQEAALKDAGINIGNPLQQ
jgi:Domain of unknown function (DUF1844)